MSHRKWTDLFSVDLRSLAVFRITLGLTLLVDTILRLPNVRAFYSDDGVLPRAVLLGRFDNPWHIGFLLSNGQPLVVTLMFLGGLLPAVLLILGYRSRLAAFACWLFVLSVQSRNFLVVHGGDEMLRLLLFWSWLLPLGARYSIDRALNRQAGSSSAVFCSIATAGLVLQICFVYWFSALQKLHPVWLREGSAIYYALNYDVLASSFGKWLLQFPTVLKDATFATVGLELVGPVLIFLPIRDGFFRLCASLVFMMFHVGLAMSFHLGSFPWLACVAWSAILPSSFWNRFVQPADGPEATRLRPSFLNHAFSAAALLLIFAWNVTGLQKDNGVGLGTPWWEIGSLLQLNQKWALFAPYPSTDDGWYVIDAELFSGERVDPLRDGQPVRWEKPPSVAEAMKDSMWRKYLMHLARDDYSAFRLYFGRYLCRAWNSSHSPDRRIKTMHIYFMLEMTPPPGEPLPRPQKRLLWRHYCFDKPADW